MAHWAILIGISQYQFLQPLSFAQQDAQALRNFLISEAGFSPGRCFLLTDTSPTVQNRPTQPTKRTIQGWLDDLCQTLLQPGDLLWCFFSGHGVCEQGQDYLMPLDGDLNDVAGTGLAIRSLFERFKTAANSTVFTLLDMSRSQMGQTEGGLGAQTLELAKELEIATLLSCAVNEVSHESPRIRNGFFTVALLEGLRNHQCSTPGTLSKYLKDALPQLCEHYWQAPQHPEAVVPTLEAGFELILPQTPVRTASVPAKPPISQPPVSPSAIGTRNGSSSVPAASQTASAPPAQVSSQPRVITSTPQKPSTSPSPEDDGPYGSFLSQLVGNPNFVRPTAPDTPQTDSASAQGANANVQFPSSIPADLQQGDSTPPDVTATPSRKSLATSKDPAMPLPLLPLDDDSPSEIPDALFWRKLLMRGALGASVLLLGVIVFNPDMFAKQSAVKPTPSGINPTIAPSPNQTPPALPTLTPINSLNTPGSQPSQSRGLLDEARAKLTFNQATPFAEAINQARQVKKGDPQYTQALQDIDRWSLVILDLAAGQAKRGRFETAIKTANLLESNGTTNQATALPEERPEIRTRARELVNNWEIKRRQQQVNDQIITNAQQLIRAKQASSYHQAIVTLSKIPPGQPSYLRSQSLTKTWSEEMLRLAKERAAQGNFRDAIRAADLVPANAPNYTAAKESIALWRNRVTQ